MHLTGFLIQKLLNLTTDEEIKLNQQIQYLENTVIVNLKVTLEIETQKSEHLSKILFKTYTFFQYYNNNYRPIYHVENYFLYLAKLIHNF